MSLLSNAFESFTVMALKESDDGYGGIKRTWTNGDTIEGAMVMNSSTASKIAESMGATGAYTLTVRKDTLLDFHDVIKRTSDGKIFRTVNDSDDIKTPPTAGLNMRQYSCEEYILS